MIEAKQLNGGGSDSAFRLDGRTALVTGGTRGVGLAVAQELSAAGATVILTGRDRSAAESAARSLGSGAIGLAYDASIDGAEMKLAEETCSLRGELDILVNNAAILAPHYLTRTSKTEFDAVFQVNVRAPMFLTIALKPRLAASGKASVVNIAAAGAHRPLQGLGCYNSSKAALVSLSVTMAKEWAADGIRVNALTPGSVATDMILPKDPVKRAQFCEEMGSQNLLKRLGEPSEIARAVRFLASDASSFVTGSVLVADGGFLA